MNHKEIQEGLCWLGLAIASAAFGIFILNKQVETFNKHSAGRKATISDAIFGNLVITPEQKGSK